MLFHAHSGLRYLVLALGVAAALALVLAIVRAIPEGRMGRILRLAFVGALDLQVVLGMLVLLTRPFYPALFGHITVMIVALVVAHGVAIAIKRRPDPAASTGLGLIGVVLPLSLIVAGILAIGRPLLGSAG